MTRSDDSFSCQRSRALKPWDDPWAWLFGLEAWMRKHGGTCRVTYRCPWKVENGAAYIALADWLDERHRPDHMDSIVRCELVELEIEALGMDIDGLALAKARLTNLNRSPASTLPPTLVVEAVSSEPVRSEWVTEQLQEAALRGTSPSDLALHYDLPFQHFGPAVPPARWWNNAWFVSIVAGALVSALFLVLAVLLSG